MMALRPLGRLVGGGGGWGRGVGVTSWHSMDVRAE